MLEAAVLLRLASGPATEVQPVAGLGPFSSAQHYASRDRQIDVAGLSCGDVRAPGWSACDADDARALHAPAPGSSGGERLELPSS
jgi:hypothetical protein